MSWTLEEILAATAGSIAQAGKKSAFGEIVTDSTTVKSGSVFVALRGERFDGHRFVADAFRRGSACAIVHQDIPGCGTRGAAGRSLTIRGVIPSGATIVRVEDTLKAL